VAYDWISLTTDYGVEDGFVAACEGVMATIAGAARVIHVSHALPPGDVRRGAAVMAQITPYLPPAVHVGIVDPGVGTERQAIAVVAGTAVLVGPDNGLLLPAAEALGGLRAAYQLAERRFWLPVVSRTFHGRDIFSPAAAHVAAGVAPEELGPPLPVDQLVRLPPPAVEVVPGRVTAEVLGVDHFGTLQLAATRGALEAAGFQPGHAVDLVSGDERAAATVGSTFADALPGDLVVLVDSAGYVAVAVNRGSAQERLRVGAGADLSLMLAE
jgi:S-adenosylmethionine hydrolase